MERLQKTLAHAGVASRRKCEELIRAGRVRVNGKIVSELGTKVDPARDRIEVDGAPIRVEEKMYIALHKPRGYLSDVDEERGKKLAVDLVPSRERLYAAGRLDLNSEGLLLLTNDGDLAYRVTHPRFEHEKEYLALVAGEPDDAALAKLRQGVWYDGEMLRADHVERAVRHQRFADAERGQTWLTIILHEGKKRQIRHLCAGIGHPVLRLIRVRIGPIELGALPVGKWRALSAREVRALKAHTRSSRKNKIASFHHRD
ncbi:MAG: pseudouridine synthase [Chloroflexota bacterium]